ncbi:MAG: hypothetical protein ACL7BU_16485 [Candidatus Phlomobacter fragariae]
MTIQNMANSREGLLCAQNEDFGILIQHKTELRINSRLFAKRLSIKHNNFYELIKKNAKNLRQFGRLSFQTETCAHSTGATVNKYVLFNENQFDFMCRIVRDEITTK